ncbi:MAG TPA: HsmA family protein [Coriobacteriia bacterium]
MPAQLIVPTVLMSLALAFYSTGVWAERFRHYLAGWHVAAFWLGLACDAGGTYLMRLLTRTMTPSVVHSVTGAAALALMLGHAVWATAVVRRDDDAARKAFGRYSLVVWLIWLVPYLGGMAAGIARGSV